MATETTIRQQLQRMLAAYPQHTARLTNAQIGDMVDVWLEDLADLDDNLLTIACRNHRERSQWLPSIAEIRASAVSLMRQASPAAQTASEAWGDVKRAIRQVGYVGIPQFDNPATATTVKRMGWMEICHDDGKEGVLRAQFERMYESEIGRMESKVTQSPAVRAFVASMTPPANGQLGPGDAQDMIRQIAEAKRP